jgi:hypothetical protein
MDSADKNAQNGENGENGGWPTPLNAQKMD